MTTLKKFIVAMLIAVGFILLIADSDTSFVALLSLKIGAMAMMLTGIQLCATWKVFQNLEED